MPIARAAAFDRSMQRPRTKGPRSFDADRDAPATGEIGNGHMRAKAARAVRSRQRVGIEALFGRRAPAVVAVADVILTGGAGFGQRGRHRARRHGSAKRRQNDGYFQHEIFLYDLCRSGLWVSFRPGPALDPPVLQGAGPS
jgi:hypothetical protein